MVTADILQQVIGNRIRCWLRAMPGDAVSALIMKACPVHTIVVMVYYIFID